GIFVGKAVEILGRLLKVLQRVSGLGRNRLDHFKHLGCGFAQIGGAFSREHLAIFCAAGTFGALGDVDCHVAEQSELHQERARIAIDFGAFVDLPIDASGCTAAAAACARVSSSLDTGEKSFWTCPILRPASMTGAPCLIPAALS